MRTLSAPLWLYFSDHSTSWTPGMLLLLLRKLPAKTQRRGMVYTWVRFSSLFFQRMFSRTPTSHISLTLLPRPRHHGSLSSVIQHPLQSNYRLGSDPGFHRFLISSLNSVGRPHKGYYWGSIGPRIKFGEERGCLDDPDQCRHRRDRNFPLSLRPYCIMYKTPPHLLHIIMNISLDLAYSIVCIAII